MKKLKMPALLLAVALCGGMMTGCLENVYENAGTVDGRAIPAGLYLNLQYDAFNEAETKVNEALAGEDEEGNATASDDEVNVLRQKIEGVSAKKWISERTEEKARRFVAIEKLCRENGVVLSEDSQSYIEQMLGYWDMMAEMYETNGISQDTFVRNMTNEMLADELFLHMYGPDGELNPGEDELKKVYAEKNAHLRYIMVPFKKTAAEDGGEPEELLDEVMPIAEAMEKDVKAGKDMEEVAAKMEEVYKLIDREYSEETAASSVTTAYIEYEVDPETDDGTYPAEFREKLKSQKEGDTGVVNIGSLLLVYQVIPAFESEEEFEENRDSIIRNMYQDDFDAWLEETYNQYEVKWEPGARWYMRPQKIDET